jgi:dimethylaniline monooxygenase (N-oxide forming)
MNNLKQPVRRAAVIGAGAAGLSALKALREEGFDAVAFEQSAQVGGVWCYDESVLGGGGPAYRSLTTNTSARMMAFSDFPMPQGIADFPGRAEVLQYLNDYTDHFDLRAHIRFNATVEKLEPTPAGRWALSLKSDLGPAQLFDVVIVASGFYRQPRWPTLPGLDSFCGQIMHSIDYCGPEPFAGQRVVVIGAGSSGSDAAAEISQSAAQVELAARSGVWYTPHARGGKPSDHSLTRLSQLVPPAIKSRFVHRTLLKIYREMGIQPESLGLPPFDRTRTRVSACTRILPQLRSGAVRLKPGVERIEPGGVVYADGTSSPADWLLIATGYTPLYTFLPEAHRHPAQLYRHIFPVECSNLALIGMHGTSGAVYPVLEMQARFAARVFSGAVSLPSADERRAAIQTELKRHTQRGTSPTRVDRFTYMEELAGLLGVRPQWWRHPGLLRALLTEPVVAAQYRLDGPGKSPRAADILSGRWRR